MRVCGVFIAAVLGSAVATAGAAPRSALAYDVIIYGATPAGILAAVAAAGEHASVALLDPRGFIGGAVAGGLCETDTGTTLAVIGGRTLAFFKAMGAHYGNASAPALYAFEPHVASAEFARLLAAAGVAVSLRTRLVSGERTPGGALVTATDAAGGVHAASVWIDASYEGFLLPLARISHTFGREPGSQYGESVAGVVPSPYQNNTNYTMQGNLFQHISPTWANGTLIPLVGAPPGAPWTGDARVQAYNVRWTGTDNASNMVPFSSLAPPRNYDPAVFELYRRVVGAAEAAGAVPLRSTGCNVVGGGALPHSKWDNNQQLTDFVGQNWEYPAAVSSGDWAAQQAIFDLHLTQTLGYLYYLSHDPAVPQATRDCLGSLGFPLDEFVDTDHFPPQVYVREALRMVGPFVFTQADRELDVTKPDSIGMGAYTIDTMHASRYAVGNETLMEGGLQAPSFLPKGLAPFQIPYRALLPARSEVTNVLVPVALSASHIGFGSLRLEPTWMTIGESAGVAAAQAVAQGVAVQNIDVPRLQARLRALGQVLEL